MRRFLHLGIAVLSLVTASCGKATRLNANDGAGGSSGSGGSSQGAGGAGGGAAGTAASTGGAAGGSSASGGSVAGGGFGGTSSPLPMRLDGEPIYTRVQRLTNSQWEHAVTDILRFDAPANLAENFQKSLEGPTDFTNNERVLWVDEREVIDYEAASEAAAARATGSAEALLALYPGTDPEGFVQSLGRRAFRRPLSDEEVRKYLDVFELGETLYGPGFENGASLVIRALLQSPHFLYRTELGPSGEPLTGYELAAKLSFWLLDSTPSDSLLDAAAAGELDSVDGLETVAIDMLDMPAAVEVMRDFHRQLYDLARLTDIDKSDVPEYSAAMNQELVDVSYAFFDSVFERGEGLTQILTSTRAYVGPELAPLYGLDTTGQSLEEVDLGPSRLGYFMQVPFLMLNAVSRTPDPIHRGITLLNNVLCAQLPAPENVVPPLPALAPGQTDRERITEATSGCGTPCHDAYINPLGFAFEGFDGMGQARDTDNGVPVDSSGSYPFSEGIIQFADAAELMQHIALTSEAHRCYSKMVVGYALGRDIAPSDQALLEDLSHVSRAGSLKEVIRALVRDPAFRTRQEAPL